jgi:stage III sporulation protein AC
MDIYFLLRIALVGILVSILNQILKQSGRDDLAFLTSLAGLVLVLLWLLPHITDLFLSIQQLFNIV